jgi:molybdopterin-binding protein
VKYGARNQLTGEVVEIKRGTVMCQVKVRVPAESTVCSAMTLESLDHLGIKEGSKVNAVMKPVNVLLTSESRGARGQPRPAVQPGRLPASAPLVTRRVPTALRDGAP